MAKILGIVHNFNRKRASPADVARAFLEEKAAVAKALQELPRGSNVGIEITPAMLRSVTFPVRKKVRPGLRRQNLLFYAAWMAHTAGHRVIPLESERGTYRHERAMAPVRLGERDEAKIARAFLNDLTTSKLRSVRMAKKALKLKLPLAVMGGAHAEDLEQPLRESHSVELTSAVKRRRAEFEPTLRALRQRVPEFREREQKLNAHIQKQLAPLTKIL